MLSGLRVATLYGIKPHQLGLCGPPEVAKNGLLKEFLVGHEPAELIEAALKQFKGAYPYYKLIAECNGRENPFDEEVVRAYWVGNELLENVETAKLRQMVRKDFSGQGLLDKKISEEKAKQIPDGAKPHHSFHVLSIGSVTGLVDFTTTTMKDMCRVGWGQVKECKSEKIIVLTRPLAGEKKIVLGELVEKELGWAKELLPQPKIGDWISYHWRQAVEVLTPQQVADLEKYTLQTLALLS